MKLCTVTTHSDGYFNVLLESCKRYNINLNVIGWGEKWGGWIWRSNKIIEYLKSQSPEEIIMLIDGQDTFINNSLEYTEKVFKNKNCDILLSIEDISDPILSYGLALIFDKCKERSLNGGCVIGYSNKLLKLYEELILNYSYLQDDQQMLTTLCNKDFPNLNDIKIKFDDKSEIFLNIICDNISGFFTDTCFNKNITFSNNQIVYKNKYIPTLIHGPGNINIIPFLNKINIETDNINIRNNIEYFKNNFINHVKRKPKNIIFIILIILVLYLCLFTKKDKKVSISDGDEYILNNRYFLI